MRFLIGHRLKLLQPHLMGFLLFLSFCLSPHNVNLVASGNLEKIPSFYIFPFYTNLKYTNAMILKMALWKGRLPSLSASQAHALIETVVVLLQPSTSYSQQQKEWICSLFKEWILEKSEIRVNLNNICVIHSFWICSLFKEWILEKSEIRVNLNNICVIHSFWSDHRDHSGIPSDPWGHSKMSE